MKNKQSGNLNREKIRILPGGKLSYSFFSGQNLMENAIKHCLPVILGLNLDWLYYYPTISQGDALTNFTEPYNAL